MLGIPETSDEETGITAPPVIGMLEFIGHRLLQLALDKVRLAKLHTWQNWRCTG
jgi:hypothetical protein